MSRKYQLMTYLVYYIVNRPILFYLFVDISKRAC